MESDNNNDDSDDSNETIVPGRNYPSNKPSDDSDLDMPDYYDDID
jgi:hypothetical protein